MITNVHNSTDQWQKKTPFQIFGDHRFSNFNKSTNQQRFAHSPLFIRSQMFTIQQINSRKKHHFKFLEITNVPPFTNQQINSVSHIVHYLYNHKCSQFNRSTEEKIHHFKFFEFTNFSNFTNQQINSVSHIFQYSYDHKCSQNERSTVEKKHHFKFLEIINFLNFKKSTN